MMGNAIGTTLPLMLLLSGLKNSIPNTISNPNIKITTLPATANDLISNPSTFKNSLPKNKKTIIKQHETNVACVERMVPPIFSLSETSTGMEPNISITANNVKVIVSISLYDISPKPNMQNIYTKVIFAIGNHNGILSGGISLKQLFSFCNNCRQPAQRQSL